MDKQKKQLAILGGLVLVAIIVAFVMFPKEKPPEKKPATANAAPVNSPVPVGPANSTARPVPGQPGQPGAPKKEPPLPMPDLTKTVPEVKNHKWDWELKPGEPPRAIPPYDPFLIVNIDVAQPELQKEIRKLKEDWIPDGISEEPFINEMDESKIVKLVWFKGKRRGFKEGDRLTGTKFRVYRIFETRDNKKIIVRSDRGNDVVIPFGSTSRYDD